MLRRPVPALVGAFVALLLAPGCRPSDGGDVKPENYAKTVCSALLSWKQGVAEASVRLSRDVRAGSLDVQTVKARYAAFYQDVVGRTDTLLTSIDKAGAPKLDNGTAYARELHAALAEARAGLADARTRFAALPAADLSAYAAGAAGIRDQLGREFASVAAELDRLGRSHPDKALNRAFDQQPDCKRLA